MPAFIQATETANLDGVWQEKGFEDRSDQFSSCAFEAPARRNPGEFDASVDPSRIPAGRVSHTFCHHCDLIASKVAGDAGFHPGYGDR